MERERRKLFTIQEYNEEPGASPSSSSPDHGTSLSSSEYQVSVAAAAAASSSSAAFQIQPIKHHKRRWYQTTTASFQKILSDLFLPTGYPATVQDGYLQYQLYDSLQGLCSYLRGVLCSAAVLEAAGVGDAQATALSAALTWASRDGVAMVGGLLYSYSCSHKFDAHVKEFRLFADVVNDVGFLLDMLAPVLGREYLLLVSSAAVLCKTLCGISAGATKSSITQHFAVRGNMADLNAKEATQETMVSLVGMVLGIYAARTLQAYDESVMAALQQQLEDRTATTNTTTWYLNWTIFALLTVLHVWANWKGVKLLRMRTLNRARAELVLRQLVAEAVHHGNDDAARWRACNNIAQLLPAPEEVDESLLVSAWHILFAGRLALGVPLVRVLEHTRREAMDATMERLLSSDSKYAVAVEDGGHGRGGRGKRTVLVSLLAGANPCDELKAFLHASILAQCISSDEPSVDEGFAAAAAGAVDFLFDDDLLLDELRKKGWEVDRFYFGFSRRRSRLTTSGPSTTLGTPRRKDKKEN